MAWLAPWSAILPSLVALVVSGASAWACLLCFTSYEERLQICQIFAGLDSPDLGKCEEAFADAFKGLLDTEINYEERGQLHDAFTQMTHSLQEMAAAQGSFRVAFLHAAEKMQKIILQLKEVQACIPPCGLQEVTRRFRCRGCYSKVCDLPLDCPVQDLTVTRGRQAMFSCTVNFQLPKEEITYSWKFAGAPDSRSNLLPRYSAGPRIPGADPAGAAHAPRDLLLRDHARPAPPGAALLLSERDGPAAARGDRAPGLFSGSVTLGAAGGGDGRTLEAQPGRAAGQARGSDAGQSVPARGACGLSISQCDRAGVVSPRDPESQPPALSLLRLGRLGFSAPPPSDPEFRVASPLLLRSHNPQPLVSQIQESKPYHPPLELGLQDPHFWSPASSPATH